MNRRSSPINVMALDADPLVHLGLETMFAPCSELRLVGCARTYQEIILQLETIQPDVFLTDVTLPDRSGAEACREITEKFPKTRVLFLALHQEKTAVYSAVLAGASGYILKESAKDRLIPTIELVADGHSIFEQDTLREVQNLVSQPEDSDGVVDWNLSPQQARVVELVAKGLGNKEIAKTLDLSEKTIRNYLAAVFKKLHITHRSRLISLYQERHVG